MLDVYNESNEKYMNIMHMKMLSARCRPIRIGLNVLISQTPCQGDGYIKPIGTMLTQNSRDTNGS